MTLSGVFWSFSSSSIRWGSPSEIAGGRRRSVILRRNSSEGFVYRHPVGGGDRTSSASQARRSGTPGVASSR